MTMIFRRRREGATAVAERTPEEPTELFAEIDDLVEANRDQRDPERERRILRLRHQAGARLVAGAGPQPPHPDPVAPPNGNGARLAQVAPQQLTPEVLRGAMLSSGCLVIRGLGPRDEAKRMVGEMERSSAPRDEVGEQGTDGAPYWQMFEPDPPFVL